jgi:hypothetical protein
VIGLLALVAPTVVAGKPGGGGSGGGTGGGTIYFRYDTNSHPSARLWRMSSDGSGKASLAVGVSATPSRGLHGGQRWFLEPRAIPGEYRPDGSARGELFAVREDGASAVQLTTQPDLQGTGNFEWAPGDLSVSWIARRWDLGTASVVEGGLYVADVAFDGSGNPVGLVAQPGSPALGAALAGNALGHPAPDLQLHSWSPDGTRVAYQRYSAGQIRIAVLGGSDTLLTQGGGPLWSPAGSRIMFSFDGAIWTIAPDGSGKSKIATSGPGTFVVAGAWSPTGSHLVYQKHAGILDSIAEVYRVTATGSGRTLLTGDIDGFPEATDWR